MTTKHKSGKREAKRARRLESELARERERRKRRRNKRIKKWLSIAAMLATIAGSTAILWA